MKYLNVFTFSIIAISFIGLSASAIAKPDKAKKQNKLPPGLEKKVARGGSLPPGWEKKLQVGKPITAEIYAQKRIVVPVDNKGLLTVEIGGKLLQVFEASLVVSKILK